MALKILIIRFSSIGDIILTTPVIRCLFEQKKAEIHHLVKERFRFVLEANPFIKKTHVFSGSVFNTVKALSAEKFDIVLDLQNNLTSNIICFLLGRQRWALNKINIRKWLAVRFKSIQFLPSLHIVDRMFMAIEKLNVHPDGKGLDYHIPRAYQQDLKELGLPEDYIVLVPGGSYYTKRVPVEICIRILRAFPDRFFVILGDEEDRQRVEICKENNFLNLCGKLPFHTSAWVLKHASAVITSDTGLMHVAAAFNKKIFSLWGNTIPEFGMYPYKPGEGSRTLEVKGLSCRPCSKLGFRRCPQNHFRCMMDQDLSRINL